MPDRRFRTERAGTGRWFVAPDFTAWTDGVEAAGVIPTPGRFAVYAQAAQDYLEIMAGQGYAPGLVTDALREQTPGAGEWQQGDLASLG